MIIITDSIRDGNSVVKNVPHKENIMDWDKVRLSENNRAKMNSTIKHIVAVIKDARRSSTKYKNKKVKLNEKEMYRARIIVLRVKGRGA